MTSNRSYAYYSNKFMYYIILFVSFVVAIKLNPWVLSRLPDLVGNYVTAEWMYDILSYVVSFFAAFYILPEVGFFFMKTLSEDK